MKKTIRSAFLVIGCFMPWLIMAQTPYPPLPQKKKTEQKPNPYERKDKPQSKGITSPSTSNEKDILADLLLEATDGSILLIKRENADETGSNNPNADMPSKIDWRLAVRVDDQWITCTATGHGRSNISGQVNIKESYRPVRDNETGFQEFTGSTSWTGETTGIMHGLPKRDGLVSGILDDPSEGYMLLFQVEESTHVNSGIRVKSTVIPITPEQFKSGVQLSAISKAFIGGIILAKDPNSNGRKSGNLSFRFSGFVRMDEEVFRVVAPDMNENALASKESEPEKGDRVKETDPSKQAKPSKPQSKRQRRGKRSR